MTHQRGFFAEMQYQAREAERRKRTSGKRDPSVRRAEAARREAEKALARSMRALEADRKRADREAVGAHTAAKLAEVDVLNLSLSTQYSELDSLLTTAVGTDSYVDLNTLRARAKHPPFAHEALERPTPLPSVIPDPDPPVRREAPAPRGLFNRKKKRAEALNLAETLYAEEYRVWEAALAEIPERRAKQKAAYEKAEESRKLRLAAERKKYEAECDDRELQIKKQNAALDQLINGLAYGVPDAVSQFFEIVMANAYYPELLQIKHAFSFEPSTAELTVKVSMAGPDRVPSTKAYRYTKSTDKITSSKLSQKDVRDRYSGIVHSVALRTLYEVLRADRKGLVKSVSLELGSETVDPATGREIYVPFLALATDREKFVEIELGSIVPSATLDYLGAVMSKNPVGLQPIVRPGVRAAK